MKLFADPATGADLLLFQDQSTPAQALAKTARGAGGRIWLAQDGFLSFDMARVGPVRRALWPLARRFENRGGEDDWSRRARGFARRHVYLNHYFGCTRPDHVFVQGPAMARRLQEQFGLSPGAA